MKIIRIGTRSSKLALFQAEKVKGQLLAMAPHLTDELVKIVPIKTTGDKIKDKNLYDIGGKGLFIKELEEALLEKKIDLAVHSLKDLPAITPNKLQISAVLERESAFDLFISPNAKNLAELPYGAKFGTCSPRRAAQIKNIRPDLEIVTFRGNVGTRLEKLNKGVADATILAEAGLARLNLDIHNAYRFSLNEMVPAIGQGVICIETHEDNNEVNSIIRKLNHFQSYNLILAERTFLIGLGANCNTPVGGYAYLTEDKVEFHGMVAKFDGSEIIRVIEKGDLSETIELAQRALVNIQRLMGKNFFNG